MLFLSNASLRYAVEMCQNNDDYKVCICTSDRMRFDYARDEMNEVLTGYEVSGYRRNRHGYYIYFNNGSLIRIFTANTESNGSAYHLVIADRCVDRHFLKDVLIPWEKLEWEDDID